MGELYEDEDVEEAIIHEMSDCRMCEARFFIELEEDYLEASARYCPFCGEPLWSDDVEQGVV